MKRLAITAILAGSLVLTMGAPAYAQSTPKDFDYEIVNGKRVPKPKRTVNPDGSWREERRDGNCVEIKEMSASGELKITRKCD